MKRILISLLAVVLAVASSHSQTINFSSVKVKTKTEKEKRVYEFPYDQFVMLNYGAVQLGGNSLGIQYGQVHIGGWYVSADISLSRLHFGHSCVSNHAYEEDYVSYNGYSFRPHYIDGKTSFNRVSFGAGGIVRLVIPLYVYAGMGYLYQNVTAETEEFGWVEIRERNSSGKYDYKYHYISPHSSGYFECGLQGNIKGFTMRLGYRYNFCQNNELSVGLGWTFGRESKKSNVKLNE
ncbi:MAG: hypothetical protein MJZ95_07190 [Paludibacteraceae bacterium]|nr:hypothetical protein [Paludibacteraceae bacterium]